MLETIFAGTFVRAESVCAAHIWLATKCRISAFIFINTSLSRAEESVLASANKSSFRVGAFRLFVTIVSSFNALVDFNACLAVALESFWTRALVRASRVAANAVSNIAFGQAFCALVNIIALELVGTGSPFPTPVAFARSFAGNAAEAFCTGEFALAGSTGSDVNDWNIAQSRAFRLDALFTASEISRGTNTLERSRSINAFLTDIFARMKTIFAFVDIDAFSCRDFESLFALALVAAYCIYAFGTRTGRSKRNRFSFFGRYHFAHNSDHALVNVGTGFAVAGISVFAIAFEAFSGIQAACINIAVVKSKNAFIPFSADASRSELTFFTFARKTAFAIFARFFVIAIVRAHRALVDVNTSVGSVFRSEVAAIASAVVTAFFERNAHFWETTVVLVCQASVGQLAR